VKATANNAVANEATANEAPANNAAVEAAEPREEKKNHILGFFEGFTREAVDTATGFYNLVTTNPITTAKGVVYMATHPRLAVQAITEPYTTAWKDGEYGQLAGRASFQVLTILLTSGALSKSDKGAKVGAKVAQPSQKAVEAAGSVVDDMAKSIAKRQAIREVEKQIANGSLAASKKGITIANLTRENAAKVAERLAQRGIADKVAQGIAASGVADDAIAKVMSSAGGKVTADNIYRFASAGMKAGLGPDDIAAQMSKFGAMSAKKAATEFPVALRLMQAQGRTAAAIAAAASPSGAAAVAGEMQRLERMAAGTTDDALKAGYQAQLDALKQATAANPRTSDLVADILAGKKVGRAERRLAEWGQGLDNAGNAIGRTADNVGDAARGVKNFLDSPQTLGDYANAVGAVPRAIGRGIGMAADGVIDVLKKGIAVLPDFRGFKMPNIAKLRVPSPWEILTAPVTVPLGTAKWALANPGRAIGLAGTLGNLSNVGKMGHELSQRVEDPTEPTNPGWRHYELQEGDTLESIAERELGDPNRWEEIYNLNRELFDSLGEDGVIAAGTQIKLPVDGEAPADNTVGGAAAYKAGLLELIDEKIGEADAETKPVLEELRGRLADMEAGEVFKLKEQLEAQGLVVPTEAPDNNAPVNNAPGNNAPGNNAPGNNAPGNNGPVNNAPGNNAPVNNVPGTKPPAAPTTEYTVKRGDTLTEIAQAQLGSWQRWRELVDLNKDRYPTLQSNPDFLAIGWKLQVPAKQGTQAPAGTPPAGKTKPTPTAPPPDLSSQQRRQIVMQFNLEQSEGNWRKFWQEVSTYPHTAIGPDAGTDADRRQLQMMLGKLGFPVKVSGSYYELGADGKPKTDARGNHISATADAVVAFKEMAGITQSYSVMGSDGKPTADVNEYVDQRTKETMAVALRTLQDGTLRNQRTMEAAVKEAARLQQSSIGPEVGTPEARALVQTYLNGLGYKVDTSGAWDQATIDALTEFKRKNGLAAPFKNDRGQPVFLPYVDGPTAEALYEAAVKAQQSK
ncbi:MAG: LysM peptidoglycan-binding domain-containing protein, partial [Candidatus Sericytochromatia bacterium]